MSKVCKAVLKILLLYLFYFFPISSYSNIIYDKNDVIISEIDLNYYKQLYSENFGQSLNESTAIKNIVIIKKLIKSFEKNNPYFLEKIDEILIEEYGSDMMEIQMVKDFMRYLKINNEFIYDYYRAKFNITDLKNIFDSFEKIELPISKNNCLTILKMHDFKNNKIFINNFYENLKKQNKKYEIEISNEIYDVCIDSRTNKIFEQSILNYINLKTKDDFKKFVYEQQKKN